MRNSVVNDTFISRLGFGTLIILYLTIFISKAGINIALSFAVCMAVVFQLKYGRWQWTEHKLVTLCLFSLVFGLITSVFSASSFPGLIQFLRRFRFILILAPLSLFVEERWKWNILFGVMLLSALCGILYGLLTGQFEIIGTFRGFHMIGRNADMLMILSLTLVVFLCYRLHEDYWREIVWKGILLIIVGILTWGMLMSEIRGAWLGFVIGLIFFAVFYQKKLLFVLLAGMTILLVMNSAAPIRRELASLANVDISKPNIEYDNTESNMARLSLWISGLEFARQRIFFGTGVKNSREEYIAFFNSKPKDYQEKYHWALRYAGNYHNSYLQILIENGLLFFLFFFGTLGYVLSQVAFRSRHLAKSEKKYVIAGLTVSVGFLSSQFFHGELTSYGALVYYFVLFGAFLACRAGTDKSSLAADTNYSSPCS